MAENSLPTSKRYRLKPGTPLSQNIQVRSLPGKPLVHIDPKKKTRRAIRYATNQESPYVDAQKGEALLGHVWFEDGFLDVPEYQLNLQKFLAVHPQNGTLFEEIVPEDEAAKELEAIEAEADAVEEARNLKGAQLEQISRVLFKNISNMTTKEMRRDVVLYAKRNPIEFTNKLKDPDSILLANVYLFFEQGLLLLKNNNKEVYWNTPNENGRMLLVPHNANYANVVAASLKNENIEMLKILEQLSEELDS